MWCAKNESLLAFYFCIACENSESFSFGFPGWFLRSTEEMKTNLSWLFIFGSESFFWLSWRGFLQLSEEKIMIISCDFV